jgi:HSP20 family protein
MFWTDRFGAFERSPAPWTGIERMQNEMNRLLSRLTPAQNQDFPAVNVWASEERAVVTTELPGVTADAIEISAAGKVLTIRGSREPEQVEEGESYHRRERWYGKFTKTLDMPFPVDPAKVEAKFNKGVLSILLPRLEADKPKKITVKIE